MFNYYHRRCGKVVFSYPTRLENGDVVEPALAVVQGVPAAPGQELICLRCCQCLRFTYDFLSVSEGP